MPNRISEEAIRKFLRSKYEEENDLEVDRFGDGEDLSKGSGSHGVKRFVEQGLLAQPGVTVETFDSPEAEELMLHARKNSMGVVALDPTGVKLDVEEPTLTPAPAALKTGVAANAGRGVLKAVRGSTATADLEQQGPEIQAPDMSDPSVTHMYDSDQEPTQIPQAQPEPIHEQPTKPPTAQTQSSVQAPPQRPGAPQDDSAYYAALKGIATAGRGSVALGNMDLGGGYYDQKIKQEGQKQANYQAGEQDWRTQNAAMLRQKFQADESQKQRDLTGGHYSKLEEGAAADRTERNRHNIEMEKRQVPGMSADGLSKQQTAQIAKADSDLPGVDTVNAMNRLMEEVRFREGPASTAGQEEGKSAEAWVRAGTSLVPFVGKQAGDVVGPMAGDYVRKGRRAEGLMQDANHIMMNLVIESSGKAFTQEEVKKRMEILGMALKQGPEAFDRAFENLATDLGDRTKRYMATRDPKVAEELNKRGVVPHIETRDEQEQRRGKKPPVKGVEVPGNPAYNSSEDRRDANLYTRNSAAAIDAAQEAEFDPVAKVQQSLRRGREVGTVDGEDGPGPKGWDGVLGTDHWFDKAIDWTKKKFSEKDAIQVAKDNEDEEKRRKRNPTQ